MDNLNHNTSTPTFPVPTCKKTVRIVLAGGIASGKSKCLEFLPTFHSEKEIGIISEGATFVMENTSYRPKKDPVLFQIVTNFYYMIKEKSFENSDIIIMDRSLADSFVYLDTESAEKLLGEGVQDTLDRYDIVFYFKPYPLELLSSLDEGNRYRNESPEERDALDKKTVSVYSNHKNFHIIPSVFDTARDKAIYVAKYINKILAETVFDISEQ